MSLILRNVKGSPLTYTEMDNNLEYLEDLIVGTSGGGLYLELAGGTMSGDINIDGNRISDGSSYIELDNGLGNSNYLSGGSLVLKSSNGSTIDISDDVNVKGPVQISNVSNNTVINGIIRGLGVPTDISAEVQVRDNSSSSQTTDNTFDNNVTFISAKNATSNSGVVNSVILGGRGLNATTNNTVYVPSLNTDGSITRKTRTITASHSVTNDDHIIFCDTTSASFTVTLPSPVDGREIVIKDSRGLAGTNDIVIDTPSTAQIDGSATATLFTNFESVTLVSDGTNWSII